MLYFRPSEQGLKNYAQVSKQRENWHIWYLWHNTGQINLFFEPMDKAYKSETPCLKQNYSKLQDYQKWRLIVSYQR